MSNKKSTFPIFAYYKTSFDIENGNILECLFVSYFTLVHIVMGYKLDITAYKKEFRAIAVSLLKCQLSFQFFPAKR